MNRNLYLGMLIIILFTIFCLGVANSEPPKFEEEFTNITLPEGYYLNVSCEASGNPNYTWYNEDGRKIYTGMYPKIKVQDEWSGAYSVLIFEYTQKNHTGLYTCDAENKYGLRSKIFQIIIKTEGEPPRFDEESTNITVPEGIYLEVECMASGYPSPNYTWWYNERGRKINPEVYPSIEVRNGWSNSSGTYSTLIFETTHMNHTGFYTCEAENKYGLRSKLFQININNETEPIFDDEYSNITVAEGQILEVECLASGFPTPNYTWYDKYGQEIYNGMYHSISIRNGWNSSIGAYSLLIFRFTETNSTGNYTCEAENKHGLTSKRYEIIIKNETDFMLNILDEGELKIESVKALKVTSTSILFQINFTGKLGPYEVQFFEKLQRTRSSAQFSGRTFELHRLTSSGVYTVSLSPVVPRGHQKVWSKAQTFVLLPDVPDVIFRKLNDGLLNIEWFRKVDDISRQSIDKYQLSYFRMQMQSANYWVSGTCSPTIEIPACFGNKYTIADLPKNAYYEIVLKAHTDAGYGTAYRNKIYIPV